MVQDGSRKPYYRSIRNFKPEASPLTQSLYQISSGNEVKVPQKTATSRMLEGCCARDISMTSSMGLTNHPCGTRVIQGSEPDFSCHLRQELRDVPGQLSVLILTSGHPRMHHEKSGTQRNGSSFYQIHPPKWGTNATRKNLKPTSIPQTPQNYGLEHWSC